MANKNSSDKNPFQSGGANYAAYRPIYPDTLAQSLTALVASHQLALDVGCGNGQLTTLLSPYFQQVIGTDPSKSQLQQAPVRDNVRYFQQFAEHTELPDHAVDLVVVAQAAHWFDLERFYAEVERISKPHAVLALISYGVPYIDGAINSAFQQGYWQTVHEFWPAERAAVENAYSELYFPFEEMAFPNLSIEKSFLLEDFVYYIKTWSSYKNALKLGKEDVFESFFEKLKRRWPNGALQRVVWPIAVRVGKVH